MVRGLVLMLCVMLGCDGAAEPTATVVDSEAPPQTERSVDASSTHGAASAREAAVTPSVVEPEPEPERKPSKAEPSAPTSSPSSCCRTCKAGKACGDSCIAETKTCTKPPGCACDG